MQAPQPPHVPPIARRWLGALSLAALAFAGCDDPDQHETMLEPAPEPAAVVSAYDIVKVSPMTIDGNLSEWANVAPISFAPDPGNGRGALNNSATVKLAWDNTYLYAAYDVTDTELLALQTTRDAADLFKDDEIELYLDPQGDGGSATSMTATDYQFLANVRDAIGDFKGDGAGGKTSTYNATGFLAKAAPRGTVNATGTDTGYAIELRIAWSDLGVTPAGGQFMRTDLAVGDRDGSGPPPVNVFDWANLTTSYNNPSAWKDVRLVTTPPRVSAYDLVKVPAKTIDGDLSDWQGIPAITMQDDDDRGAQTNSASMKLAWDNTYLYAAYDVTDTELLALQTTRDATDLFKDDEIELYLDPQGDGTSAANMTATDYQFLANIRDAVSDYKGDGAGGKTATYNASGFTAKAAARGTVGGGGADTGYSIELRISWADLGVTPGAGNFMRTDLAVGDRDGSGPPPVNVFDWAGLTTTYNNPSAWKDVKFVVDASAPLAPASPALTVISSSAIDVAWTASTSNDVAGYRIYRGTTGTPALVATVGGSPYHDTGLTAGTSYKYQISTVDAAGNESPKTAAVSASTTGGGSGVGIPFGPFDLWSGNTTIETIGTEDFNSGQSAITSGNILARIQAARDKGLTLILAMTGGNHDLYMTGGVFDRGKWNAKMQTFNTAAIKNGVADAVRDGVILGNSMVDEPSNPSWGPGGTFTKAILDDMATYAHVIFPTLPMGVNGRYDWRANETYTKLDYVNHQYSFRLPDGDPGNISAWRQAALAQDGRDGVVTVFSLNVIAGGFRVINGHPETDIYDSCPEPQTGGQDDPDIGDGKNCKMTAQQLKDYGLFLGPSGAGLTLWEYEQEFFGRDDNQATFRAIRQDLDGRTRRSWKRP